MSTVDQANRCALRLASVLLLAALPWGCRGHQYGHLVSDHQADMVGSHAAGAEVYNPLIDEAAARLLTRHATPIHPAGFSPQEVRLARRICFIGVENKSIEEIGDFKDQIYQQIDSRISESKAFEPISRRYVEAALRESRLRPDALFIPQNMRVFAGILEQQGQPVDYLLYATITSGTTQSNHSKQRDYQLTLELIDVHSGAYDKESAKIRKGYHKTVAGKWWHFGLLQ